MTGREWLIVGATGQLGRELVERAPTSGARVRPAPRTEVDLARPESVVASLETTRPSLVINAAAWTDVDAAESREAEARRVNAEGVAALAEACRAADIPLIHISTDYVFGGEGIDRRPWREDDPLRPQGAYARTKAAGEQAVRETLPATGTIVRTAWLYSGHGKNFVRTMLAKARAAEPVNVVNDQWGQPTWACDVAARVVDLGVRLLDGRAPAGTYHATNSGETTWCGFAREIYALAGADPELVSPIGSHELDRPAPRPAWSVLGHEGWKESGLPPLRPWQEALADALPTIDPPPRR